MKFFKRILFTLGLLVSLAPALAQPITTIQWESSVQELGDNRYQVQFKGKLLPGWHTYDLHSDDSSTVVTLEPSAGLKLVGDPFEVNASKREFDDIFQVEMGYYYDEIILGQQVELTGKGGVLRGNINWRACEEYNCNSPEDWEFSVTIGNPEAAASAEVTESAAGGTDDKTLWGLIIEAILWGFAALVTPCVFPMVPMTVSFFMKGSGSPAAGRFKAAMFGLFIVLLYTLPIAAIILITRIVGGDAVTADIFNWLSTHWLPNIIFFIVFMVFAASFFGAFEITLPSWMVNKSDKNADKGGMAGIFFMALTLVLVSFSCTGPIVGSVLIKSTAGEFWTPIVTMLAFSLVIGLAFTVLAMFPSLLQNMPKSGGWLNSVKVVLGFIEVAFGLKFLSMADQTYHWGLLDREVYLAIWIVVFTLLGLYLLGKLRFAHDDELKHISVTRLALAIVSFSFVVYMLPGMWGAPLKGISGYMPPLHTQDYILDTQNLTATAPTGAQQPASADQEGIKYADILHWPYNLPGYFDFNQAMEAARKADKPLFVDVTGIGCVNCREMEATVWSDPRVQEIMRNDYVLVALYTDDKTRLPESEWVTTDNGKLLKDMGRVNSYLVQKRFGVNGQPSYLLLDHEGNLLAPVRGANKDVDAYIEFLQSGLEAYKAGK